MSDPVKVAAEAVPADGVDFHIRTDDELRELEEPGQEYVCKISVFDERLPLPEEVDDDEVTADNYLDHLPVYTDDNPPNINLLALANGGELLDANGRLVKSAQEQYEQTPPDPQASFQDVKGV